MKEVDSQSLASSRATDIWVKAEHSETKGLEGGMRVGNEGGNSVCVKFGIGERVNTESGLSF